MAKSLIPLQASKAGKQATKDQEPPTTGLNRFNEVMDLLARRSEPLSEEFNELLHSVGAAHKVISIVAPKYETRRI
jgi:hypothetical protein